jgi:hypothetical protein
LDDRFRYRVWFEAADRAACLQEALQVSVGRSGWV